MFRTRLKDWIWIHNKNLHLINHNKITGKYMFFCSDRYKLMELAEELIKKYGLELAKVPDDNFKVGNDWVLCVYDESPRLHEEMKEYDLDDIRYCGWKSDEETRQGKYSQEFIRNLKNQSMTLADY